MAIGVKPTVGIRLRSFRERRGWSLRALSEHCGLSINAISRIERGENSPTISSLQRLAGALAVPITDFFLDSQTRAVDFEKKGSGVKITYPCQEAEKLSNSPLHLLEPYRVQINPGCDGSQSPLTHPGKEFIFCFSGSLDFFVGEQRFRMQSGDSILFNSLRPHYWLNPGAQAAEILMVFQATQDNSLARSCHLFV